MGRSRQFAEALLGIGKHPAMVAQHRDRAGMQIARARIIAEPGPHPQHASCEARPSEATSGQRAKNFSIRPDHFDAGLLQHDFGQPDPIRIALARQRPPRQPAAMAVIPVEQQRGAGGAAFGQSQLIGWFSRTAEELHPSILMSERKSLYVMTGLVPGIHVLFVRASEIQTWMAGHRRAEATPSFRSTAKPGHDD